MKSFRLVLSLGGLALLATGLGSCLKEPEYSTTPSISNNNVRVQRYKPADPKLQPIDSIFITVNFQDGDGDLGLNDEEIKHYPYTFRNADSTLNKFNNNYFIEPLIKDLKTGRFVATTVALGRPAGEYNGRFGHNITGSNDGKTASVKGTLTRIIAFGYTDLFVAGDVVRFDVSIADRALHVSNIVRTDSIVIAPL